MDDSRATLEYCIRELQQEGFNQLGVAVLHEKRKPKKGVLPADMPFYSAIQVDDWWINYPWDALDIDEHYCNVANQSLPEN